MSERTVDTRKCGTCGIFRLTTIIAPDTRACPECGLQRRPMDFEAAAKPAEPQPDAQVCAKQYHLHVWSLSSRWVAVAQAEDVATARKILLEEIDSSGDGSCPIREQAAKFVAERGPGIWHRRGAEFELTDSANLEEADAECDKLRDRIKELEAAEQRATRAAGEKLKKVLTEHWLFSMHCDHKKETDIATCACGWTGKTEPTVGFAVEGWVNHVLAKSAAPPLTAFKALADALKFYADPNTYFAIGIFPDKPCGDFMDDFSETELGSKPGKRARAAIAEAEKS